MDTSTGAELTGRALVEGGIEHKFGVHGYINPADRCLQRAFVTAEPFPPSLRAQLQDKVASVREGFGTAETGTSDTSRTPSMASTCSTTRSYRSATSPPAKPSTTPGRRRPW